jgi:hypothetical protein
VVRRRRFKEEAALNAEYQLTRSRLSGPKARRGFPLTPPLVARSRARFSTCHSHAPLLPPAAEADLRMLGHSPPAPQFCSCPTSVASADEDRQFFSPIFGRWFLHILLTISTSIGLLIQCLSRFLGRQYGDLALVIVLYRAHDRKRREGNL